MEIKIQCSIELEFALFINLCFSAHETAQRVALSELRTYLSVSRGAPQENQTIKKVREKSNNQNPTNTTFPSHSFSVIKKQSLAMWPSCICRFEVRPHL